jgi:FlaA1/EpsC-like NDP-sugar epimerase
LSFHVDAKQQRLITWGAGSRALVVAEIARQLASDQLIGFVDNVTQGHHGRFFLGLPVSEKMKELATISAEGECEINIAIGHCATRLHLAPEANTFGFRRYSVEHTRAIVAL